MNGTARDIAVQSLRDREGKVSRYLNYLLDRASLSPADRGLARELAIGVVRRQGTLNAIVGAYLKEPGKALPTPVGEILQIAMYQLIFLDRIPHFAAVDEAVEQADRFHHKRQAALINGLLRAFLRELPDEPPAEGLSDRRDAVPLEDGRWRRLGRNVFADPQQKPMDYLSQAYSMPVFLISRWVERYGRDKAAQLALQAGAHPPLVARVNAMKGSVEEALTRLQKEGQVARPHANGQSVVLEDVTDLFGLSPFRDGMLQPQDPTATAVVATAKIRPGQRVLDFCAAPGTKTMHIAERMENQGEIVAVDVSAEKLHRIEMNSRRMGASIVTTCLAEDIARLDLRSFDLVLVDAPCSNTGVLARRPDARWRFTPENLSQIAATQFALLLAAAEYVAPGGQLIYSTCSVEPEENEQIAEKFTKRLSRLRRLDEKTTLPGPPNRPEEWRDGGFWASFEGA